ncbi:acyltransferase [Clostridium autoethanogenum]|uniref:Acyltransferase n=1 Tax=Clostridium autoethanogenum TaxID=84023 RepID=A0A3M0S1D2_9CLOT|nr:acyltransferase [Clostridium autoethanogenum]RMC92309.1 acyltransferase [Clostridium autoethanogenum]
MKKLYWQKIRGICILTVVLIHALAYYSYLKGTWEFDIWILFRQIINFPVAVFFFLSGYFTKRLVVKENVVKYYQNRGGRLLIPLLIWSAVYSLFKIGISLINHEQIGYCKLIYQALTGQAAWPFYYIFVLLQLTIITPLLLTKLFDYKWCAFFLLITPAYMCYVYYHNLINTGVFFTNISIFDPYPL